MKKSHYPVNKQLLLIWYIRSVLTLNPAQFILLSIAFVRQKTFKSATQRSGFVAG